MNSVFFNTKSPVNWTYAPPNSEYVSLNLVSIMVTLPVAPVAPAISAKMAPPFFEEVTFLNSQFSIYSSPPALVLIAPAVIIAFKSMNFELIIEALEVIIFNAGA